ncbi:hypothetical protein [Niveispirillum sp.]|uniref:hypothetical protein n=1 Tax=Niveispirillum sp. TaxID=1917217 RepID=UPI001B5C0D25|nr:hypothetical protein [Niveispirillum sp.]MBP7339538.1 hypothetical protein [Niveispirillum sp.]
MRALGAATLAIALILAGQSMAFGATGHELAAATDQQKRDYIKRAIEAVAQSFQETDGATVRAKCVNRWYQEDAEGSNIAILRNSAKFPDDDPIRIIMAMMVKQCGKDKDDGLRILRERVERKLDASDKAAQQAKEEAEAELRDIQRGAWRLPDGRRIYQSQNGAWHFENGSVVPPALVQTRTR